MFVEVLKPVDAGDGKLEVGEIVDASDWRMTRQLVAQRYVRPAQTPKPKGKATKENTNE
jgi:hypothetical protein